MSIDRTKENIKMLDEINFDGFFAECSEDIGDLMDRVRKKYDDSDFSDNEIMQGSFFNWIDQWDLCEYLKERYPEIFHSYEVTSMYYYID